jgi:hypothetical protein
MKQLCENIECQDLRAKFFIGVFWHFKFCLKHISIYFKNREHMLPWAKTLLKWSQQVINLNITILNLSYLNFVFLILLFFLTRKKTFLFILIKKKFFEVLQNHKRQSRPIQSLLSRHYNTQSFRPDEAPHLHLWFGRRAHSFLS